eukprot:gene16554-7977_t
MERSEYVPPGTNSQLFTESFGCQFCSRSFKNQRGLSQHLRCCRKDKQGNISNLNSNNNTNFQGSLVTSSCSDFVQDLTVNSNDFANVQPSTKRSNDALATRTQSSSSIQPELTYNQRTLPLFHPMPVSEIGEPGDSAHTSILLDNGPKVWGIHSKKDVQMVISAIYEEVVYWRRNIFMLPTGSAGKRYIAEMTRLINAWNEEVESLKDIAIKTVMIMPALLLQKPSFRSKAKQHGECLRRRMDLQIDKHHVSSIENTNRFKVKALGCNKIHSIYHASIQKVSNEKWIDVFSSTST